MHDVTRILSAIEKGDHHASEELLPLVYEELRRLAADKIAQERPGQTLQATALVHEAYLRLVNVEDVQRWDSRGHFFAAAAEAMRRILVEQARRKHSQKRGGGARRVGLAEAEFQPTSEDMPATDLLALDEALQKFEVLEPMRTRVVKLRCFAGLSVPDIAKAMGISEATVRRHWVYARSWLYRKIEGR